jgi:hypothetical protein
VQQWGFTLENLLHRNEENLCVYVNEKVYTMKPENLPLTENTTYQAGPILPLIVENASNAPNTVCCDVLI